MRYWLNRRGFSISARILRKCCISRITQLCSSSRLYCARLLAEKSARSLAAITVWRQPELMQWRKSRRELQKPNSGGRACGVTNDHHAMRLTSCGTNANRPPGTICAEYSSSLPPLIQRANGGVLFKIFQHLRHAFAHGRITESTNQPQRYGIPCWYRNPPPSGRQKGTGKQRAAPSSPVTLKRSLSVLVSEAYNTFNTNNM